MNEWSEKYETIFSTQGSDGLHWPRNNHKSFDDLKFDMKWLLFGFDEEFTLLRLDLNRSCNSLVNN